jgi:hypothetical protein
MEEIYKGDFYKATRDYLRSSYAYYIQEIETEFSDSYYDYLCRYLLNNLDKIENPYKHLLCEDSLRCGSGFQLKEADYPEEFKVGYSK